MNRFLPLIVVFALVILANCTPNLENDNTQTILPPEEQPSPTMQIPVNYDFERLNIHLNTPVTDTSANLEWKWDHMSSPGSIPDPNGENYYVNIEQPSFTYKGESTQPTLSAQTYDYKIIAFSATTLFTTQDTTRNAIGEVLDELTNYALLKKEGAKDSLLKQGHYKYATAQYTETLDLNLEHSNEGYSRLTYLIKLKQ